MPKGLLGVAPPPPLPKSEDEEIPPPPPIEEEKLLVPPPMIEMDIPSTEKVEEHEYKMEEDVQKEGV